jgi:hypothetical protein
MQSQSTTRTKTASVLNSDRSGILQRQCANCGQHTISGEGYQKCSQKQQLLQRRSTNQAKSLEVPPIVQEVLRSPSKRLPW